LQTCRAVTASVDLGCEFCCAKIVVATSRKIPPINVQAAREGALSFMDVLMWRKKNKMGQIDLAVGVSSYAAHGRI